MRFRFVMLLAVLAFWTAGGGSAAADDSREATYRNLAMKAALAYDRPIYYTYAPTRAPQEVAASSVAINAHMLLEAYRHDGASHWLEHARIAGDTLLAHADENGDGKTGWGRYWNLAAPSGDSSGGNTTFARGCSLPRNHAYDDELYDDARITHFLLELFHTTGEQRYLAGARKAIDDTWDHGEQTFNGNGFAYDKTIGPCDRGWQMKNINMLMAVPMALLAKATGDARYRKRAEQLIYDERAQIEHVVDGKPAPNLGYYSIATSQARAGHRSGYIEAAQTVTGGAIGCNLKTGSGESCTNHLGLEARGLALAERLLGSEPESIRRNVLTIMSGLEARASDMCTTAKTKLGFPLSIAGCSAYYCALRQFSHRFDDLCLARVTTWGTNSQETVLGLFWGASDLRP
jgi:hypothetical protein